MLSLKTTSNKWPKITYFLKKKIVSVTIQFFPFDKAQLNYVNEQMLNDFGEQIAL